MIGTAFLAVGLFAVVLLALFGMWWQGVVPISDENIESADRHCPICSAEPARLCKRRGIMLMLHMHRARAWGRK